MYIFAFEELMPHPDCRSLFWRDSVNLFVNTETIYDSIVIQLFMNHIILAIVLALKSILHTYTLREENVSYK